MVIQNLWLQKPHQSLTAGMEDHSGQSRTVAAGNISAEQKWDDGTRREWEQGEKESVHVAAARVNII